MAIKSFRGNIADGTIDTISLSTNNGSTGYRIVKFIIMPQSFDANEEYSVKVFSIPPGTPTTTFDFSDNTLLAASFIETIAGAQEGVNPVVIFDNTKFNQDIYVTLKTTTATTNNCNYYIELETSSLALDENTVATLKDIRNITQANE